MIALEQIPAFYDFREPLYEKTPDREVTARRVLPEYRLRSPDSDREIKSIFRLAPSARAVLAKVFRVRLLSLPDSI
jgi:hypothetical protein